MIQSPKTLEFLKKLKDIGNWNDYYDYSEVQYINNLNKVTIIDKKFNSKHLISPQKLLDRNTNCTIRNCLDKNKYLINEFIEKHGDRYDYSKVNYIGSRDNVLIICKKHGEFQQISSAHKKGAGCPKCVGKNKSDTDIIKEFKSFHGEKYDYSKVRYVNSKTDVEIICRDHGVFKQTPSLHLLVKESCPKCKNNISNTTEFLQMLKDI